MSTGYPVLVWKWKCSALFPCNQNTKILYSFAGNVRRFSSQLLELWGEGIWEQKECLINKFCKRIREMACGGVETRVGLGRWLCGAGASEKMEKDRSCRNLRTHGSLVGTESAEGWVRDLQAELPSSERGLRSSSPSSALEDPPLLLWYLSLWVHSLFTAGSSPTSPVATWFFSTWTQSHSRKSGGHWEKESWIPNDGESSHSSREWRYGANKNRDPWIRLSWL